MMNDMSVHVPCNARSRVNFINGNGIAGCDLSQDTAVQGIFCRAGTKIEFHKNGWLWRCEPDADISLDGVPIRGGARAELQEDGRLWRGGAGAGGTPAGSLV